MKTLHIVPLASQLLEILKELKNHTGHLKYLFPGLRASDRPMSENTVNAAQARLKSGC